MHYYELDDDKDKILHILYAGFVCGYFTEAKDECVKAFGNNITDEMEQTFNEQYRSGSTKM